MLLDAALSGQIEILLSTALVLEYESVLARPEHLIASEFTLREIEEILDALCRVGTRIPIWFQWRTQLNDPNDEMVLDTALNGRAQAIVTFNRADFAHVAESFGLMVLSPREALERIEML